LNYHVIKEKFFLLFKSELLIGAVIYDVKGAFVIMINLLILLLIIAVIFVILGFLGKIAWTILKWIIIVVIIAIIISWFI
jgi:hypothetical protein